MSYSDPANPYSSPAGYPAGGAPPSKPVVSMDYMRILSYIFENPNWFVTVLCAALCGLIPIIGPIVLQGYRYEVVIGLLAAGGARYPDFDFNRFGDYLMRGLWPFLVGLVCSFALVPFYIVVVAGSLVEGKAGAAIAILGQLALMVIVPVFALVLQPMLLRAALTQDFVQAFQFEWIKDFFIRVWLELVLGLLFLMVAGMVLVPLGFLACCIGIFAVAPILALAQANLLFQVYSLYLARGGTQIPIKLAAQPMMGPPPGGMPPGYPPKPM